MNRIILVILGFAILLLLGCTQQTEKKTEGASNISETLGEGDQQITEADLPPTLPDDSEASELENLTNELG